MQTKIFKLPAGQFLTAGKKFIMVTTLCLTICAQLSFSQTGFNDRWFLLTTEMYGPYGYQYGDVQLNLNHQACNTLTFWPPFDNGMKSVIDNNNAGLFLMSYGSPRHNGSAMSYTDVRNMEQSIGDYTASKGSDAYKIWWNPMPEWDQSGGNWVPGGRPSYAGLTRAQACQRFLNYYKNNCEFSTFGKTPADRFGCKIACVTDFPCNTAAAYEMGVDLVMVERTIDELSDISTGIPFVRGLSRQYNKVWGIDLSTWRTSNDAATSFDAGGKLIGGWSPSYLRRIAYVSYMSGANVIQTEASLFYYGNGSLNPLGQMNKDFGDFCLNRHTNVGRTDVSTAWLFDFNNGFDPKHWIWCQSDAVWYQDIPYSDGDFMINNFFKSAWPEHWLHGLCPGAPFADSKGVPNTSGFQSFLNNGGDVRPYEPMCPARWGSNFDIIYDNASVNTMQQYKTILLVGDVKLTANLKNSLQQFVNNGGTLVLNSQQVSDADTTFIGVTLKSTTTGRQSKWLADGEVQTESSFRYTKVTPTTASVIANNNGSDPLITSNAVGQGKVIFTTPYFLQNSAQDALLKIGEKLIGDLVASHMKATVTGPFMVDYIVNTDTGKIIVTVVNNTGNDWNGTVSFDQPSGGYTTEEWISDQPVTNSLNNSKVEVAVSIPEYDLKIITLNYQPATSINSIPFPLQTDANLLVWPNPFTSNTAISFKIQNVSDEIDLSVYDTVGNKIKSLFVGKATSGENKYYWDGTSDSNISLSKGTYFVRLKTKYGESSKIIMYLK